MSTSTLSGLSGLSVAAAAPVVAPALALRFLASRAAKMSLFLMYASARVRSSQQLSLHEESLSLRANTLRPRGERHYKFATSLRSVRGATFT